MAMHTWFECKIRYEKTMENGMNKKGYRTLSGRRTQFYGSGSTYHRRDDTVYFRRIHGIGHQTCQLQRTVSMRRGSCRPLVQMQAGFITLDEKSGAEEKKRLPRYWCRQPTCVMR